MTRSELIQQIARHFPKIPPQDVATAVGELLEQMSEALVSGERIDIRGFGCFMLLRRPAHARRKPRTKMSAATVSRGIYHPRRGKQEGGRHDGVASSG